MARLPYLDPENAEPHTAAVLRKAPDLGIFRMVANAQRAFPAWMRFGGTLFDAIRRGDHDDPALGEDGRLVVRFTTQVVRDASPDEETFAAMTARFTPREIMHLLLVIGQYMMLGRIMATAQIDLEPAIGGARLLNARDAPRTRSE